MLSIALPTAFAAADTISTVRRTQAGTEVLLRTHARWDGQCNSVGLATIEMVDPPTKGRIDIRKGEVTVGANLVGNTPCKGQRMPGILVYFLPDAGFRGIERFRYRVRYGSGYPPINVNNEVTVE